MERVDIYNKERIKQNYTKAKIEKLAPNEFIIIAHLIIFNSRNEMLIQKRALNKQDWPNYWDISSGGGVMAGESAQECAEREAYEELGVQISLDTERPHLTVHFPKGFDDYYITEMDLNISKLKIQKSELVDIAWADQDKILRMMHKNLFVNYNEGFIQLLFSMRKNRGTYFINRRAKL